MSIPTGRSAETAAVAGVSVVVKVYVPCAACAVDLQRSRIPADEMLVDHVIRIAGREAIALHEDLALRVEQRQLGREALRDATMCDQDLARWSRRWRS